MILEYKLQYPRSRALVLRIVLPILSSDLVQKPTPHLHAGIRSLPRNLALPAL
jgi:hypothetical protein